MDDTTVARILQVNVHAIDDGTDNTSEHFIRIFQQSPTIYYMVMFGTSKQILNYKRSGFTVQLPVQYKRGMLRNGTSKKIICSVNKISRLAKVIKTYFLLLTLVN